MVKLLLKIKLTFILPFLIILCWSNASAQHFQPLSSGFNYFTRCVFVDNIDSSIYAGGNFNSLADGTVMNNIARWNGTTWDSLGAGLFGFVSSIVRFNDTLYAGGTFSIRDSAGGYVSANFAFWDGVNWRFTAGVPTSIGISRLRVLNGNLFAVGAFGTIGGITANRIARYDGVSWSSYPLLTQSLETLSDCVFYNGELYVCGDFNGGVGKKDIAKFDGSNWVSVGGGFSGLNTWANTFAIYQGKLYVGGYFQTGSSGDPGNNIAIWDGINWSQPGNGVMPSNVWSLREFKNELYVGGQINDASGLMTNFIVKWNGSQWQSLNANFDNVVTDMDIMGDNLYMAGGFYTIDGDSMNFITRYNPLTAINDNQQSTLDWEITPNPVKDELVLQLQNTKSNNNSVAIFNAMGAALHEQTIYKNSISVDVSRFNAGVYFVKVTDKNGLASVKRFVK